jgi:hypothetical protein
LKTLILLMVIASVLSPGVAQAGIALKPLDQVTGPDTEKQACEALVSRVVAAKLHPNVPKRCFWCELEASDDFSFQFALRFNQERCGGDSPSTLLDRFMVFKLSPVILWYDAAENRYLPWEYAWSYRKAKKRSKNQ